jgi:DHA2 family multidrug resistance protein-like MFS transporter
LSALAFGLALGVLFVIRQRTAEHPLVDITLFHNRRFRAPMLINMASNFVLLGFGLYNTQYMQSVLGMRPLTAALWSMLAMPLVGMGMGISGAIAPKVRPAKLIGGAFVISAAGALALNLTRIDSPVVVLLISAGVASAGIVAAQAIVGEMILTAAPPERAGSAAALNETAGEFGSAMGMAILGSIGAAIYHRHMVDVTGVGLPADALKTARETVGSANAVAAQIHSPAATAVLHSAREAYTSGLHLAACGGAIVMLLTAFYAFRSLRDVPVPPPAPAKPKREKKEKKEKKGTAKHAAAETELTVV